MVPGRYTGGPCAGRGRPPHPGPEGDDVAEKTVEGHVRVILSKLDLEPAASDHRRVLAVLTWLRGEA